jgi:hypothetical protein
MILRLRSRNIRFEYVSLSVQIMTMLQERLEVAKRLRQGSQQNV